MVAVITLMTVATRKLVADRLNRLMSLIPTAKPMPMMGPIKGEMSMAPMMTAVELTFRPNEAMKMANINIQSCAP